MKAAPDMKCRGGVQGNERTGNRAVGEVVEGTAEAGLMRKWLERPVEVTSKC